MIDGKVGGRGVGVRSENRRANGSGVLFLPLVVATGCCGE